MLKKTRLKMAQKFSVVAVAALMATSIAGCGSKNSGTSPSDSSKNGGKIKITNCGQERTYNGIVNRIFATSNSTNVATLAKIGAADKIVALQMTMANSKLVDSMYGSNLDKVPRFKSPIGMEAVVSVKPDLLIGSYTSIFSGASGVTEDAAHKKKIQTYVISDSCRQDPNKKGGNKFGIMDPWDAVKDDIKNYGILTGHKKEAEVALKEFNNRLDTLKKLPHNNKKPKILLYDSGKNAVFTSGRNGSPQGIIDVAGGTNIFESENTTWFKASWESIAKAKPDVVIVLDYGKGGKTGVKEKLEIIRNQPALKNLPVIKENRIIVLPLILFMSGYPNIDAAQELRVSLEKLNLAPKTNTKPALKKELEYGPVK